MALISSNFTPAATLISENLSSMIPLRHVSATEKTTMHNSSEDIVKAGTENNTLRDENAAKKKAPPALRVIRRTRIPRIFPESDQIPDQIEQGLYLGSTMAALNKKALKELNITHIIAVRASMPPPYPDDFEYKIIKVKDTVKTKIGYYFRGSFDFIEEAKLSGDGVLVHCHMGISRSATIVISYLLKKYTMKFKDALKQVKAARSIVQPNEGFVSQLLHLETTLQFKEFGQEKIDEDGTLKV